MPAAGDDRDAVLLVLGGEPWQQNGGGVFIEQMSRAIGGRVVHLSVALGGGPHARADWPWEHVSIPARRPIPGMGKLRQAFRSFASFLEWNVVRRRALRRGLEHEAARLRGLGIRRVVYFMNSIEILDLAPMLNEVLGVPYSTMEWDLIELAIDALPARRVRDRLSRAATALREGAATRGVASEGMVSMYEERWGLDSTVLRQTIVPGAKSESPAKDAFVIGLCGTMIVPDEFRAFLAALDLLDWNVDGRPIEFLWIGEPRPDQRELHPRIRSTGWVPHARSLELLSGVDLGYSGLWFATERRPWVESSFPSKIISYLSAGVPVLYHGPAYGTPAKFMKAFRVGFGCHVLEPQAIAELVAGIVREPASLSAARDEATRAVRTEFTPQVLVERVDRMLRDAPRRNR